VTLAARPAAADLDDVRTRTLRSIERRYVALTALRWLPTGLTLPVLVVLLQSRGLTLADIGLVSAVQGITVLVLELPTGGLADALGRRAVLVAASVLDVASLALLATAHSLPAILAAWAVQGAYRALESGPLDAWYVDTSQAADPAADIERGLARMSTAAGLAIAVGALGAAALTAGPPVTGLEPLVVPVLAAIALRVVDVAALARLVTGVRPTIAPGGGAWPPSDGGHVYGRRRPLAALRAGAAGAPRVVRRTVGLIARSPALLALTGVELLWGAGLGAVELFSAPRLVDLVGGARSGVVAFALAASAAWTASALGASLTGRATERAGGSPARLGAWLRVVQGGAAAAVGLVAGPVALVAGYLGFYVVHGTANAVHAGMVHRLARAGERTTILSAQSLAARLGAIATGLALAPLADRAGLTWALVVAGVVLAAAAPLYLVADRRGRLEGGRPGGR
jgi:predicted MFS family arabinose efflux permease